MIRPSGLESRTAKANYCALPPPGSARAAQNIVDLQRQQRREIMQRNVALPATGGVKKGGEARKQSPVLAVDMHQYLAGIVAKDEIIKDAGSDEPMAPPPVPHDENNITIHLPAVTLTPGSGTEDILVNFDLFSLNIFSGLPDGSCTVYTGSVLSGLSFQLDRIIAINIKEFSIPKVFNVAQYGANFELGTDPLAAKRVYLQFIKISNNQGSMQLKMQSGAVVYAQFEFVVDNLDDEIITLRPLRDTFLLPQPTAMLDDLSFQLWYPDPLLRNDIARLAIPPARIACTYGGIDMLDNRYTWFNVLDMQSLLAIIPYTSGITVDVIFELVAASPLTTLLTRPGGYKVDKYLFLPLSFRVNVDVTGLAPPPVVGEAFTCVIAKNRIAFSLRFTRSTQQATTEAIFTHI
ncbi:MAG: hypothetical protein M0R33_15430 [Methylomonas sp.]|jgi:hypothetical protein|uniref:hypothetical protein n=1 Tax=Methylomonas sp. TaxID=418 RepID=UPI0025E03CF7|nr:hypothetical protein [Methylomonas sp.]MCK9607834.1 hypothetical protein [Methylomonas sp.]